MIFVSCENLTVIDFSSISAPYDYGAPQKYDVNVRPFSLEFSIFSVDTGSYQCFKNNRTFALAVKAITIKWPLKYNFIFDQREELDIAIQPTFTCSKSTKVTAEQAETCLRLTIIYKLLANFEQVSSIALIFLFLTLNN